MNKLPDKHIFTNHALYKMRHYRLSESLVKRVVRFPKRIEESIVPNTIACMRPAQSKNYSEVWAMYVLTERLANSKSQIINSKIKQIKIITAWRYPGKSPKRDPIPSEIIEEVRKVLGSI